MTATLPEEPTPEVGMWAWHKFRELDPREVCEVSPNGEFIKLWILSSATDWIPAANYTYERRDQA